MSRSGRHVWMLARPASDRAAHIYAASSWLPIYLYSIGSGKAGSTGERVLRSRSYACDCECAISTIVLGGSDRARTLEYLNIPLSGYIYQRGHRGIALEKSGYTLLIGTSATEIVKVWHRTMSRTGSPHKTGFSIRGVRYTPPEPPHRPCHRGGRSRQRSFLSDGIYVDRIVPRPGSHLPKIFAPGYRTHALYSPHQNA